MKRWQEVFLLVAHLGWVVAQSDLSCPASFRPSKLSAVAVWVQKFAANESAQYRISDEDLTHHGYERLAAGNPNSVALLARHPHSCVIPSCATRLSTFRQKNGAILHVDKDLSKGRPGAAESENIDDDFYCANANNSCGADVPIYRLVRHTAHGPEYAYSLDGTVLDGFDKEFTPLCYAWRTPLSFLVVNYTDEYCFALKDVSHGQVMYSTSATSVFAVGATATLKCESGFAGTGVSTILCTATGWYPKVGLGSCVKAQGSDQSARLLSAGNADDVVMCASPHDVGNGTVSYNPPTENGHARQGTKASVWCNIGFVPSVGVTPTCENGDWSPSLPRCVSLLDIQCPLLVNPAHGEFVFDANRKPYLRGSSVRLRCSRGYFASGNDSSECAASGWSRALGECLPTVGRVARQASTGASCFGLSTLNGMISYSPASFTGSYASSTTAFLLCNPTFTPQGSPSSICLNGVWSPPIGQCSSANGLNTGNYGAACLDLLQPLNGVINYSPISSTPGSHPSSSIATLTCNGGNSVSGTLSSTCSNGAWSPSMLGSCSPNGGGIIGGPLGQSGLECLNPMVINGQLTYSQSNANEPQKPIGTTVTLFCSFGFTPSGPTSSTCQNGAWIPSLGVCTQGGVPVNQCLALVAPLNGNITYSGPSSSGLGPYVTGTVAMLFCTNGVIPQGASTATCQSGTWNPSSLGTCLPPGGTGGQCMTLIPPLSSTVRYSNGFSSGPFSSGTSATITCMNGVPVQGAASTTCINGVWQPTILGSCTGTGIPTTGQCLAVVLPVGAQASYSSGPAGSYNSGTMVTVTCTAGGSVLGIAACMSGQWTPPISGVCSGSPTGGVSCAFGMGPPLGGTVSYSGGLSTILGPYPSGTIATATCSSGQFMQGTPTSTCSNGQWQPTTFGTCGGTPGQPGATQCSPLAPPIGATATYSSGQAAMYNAGTTAAVQCSSGSFLGIASCLNGQWSPPITATCSGNPGSNNGLQCTSAIPSIGGQITYSDGSTNVLHSGGSTATLICTTGTVTGSTTATCQNGAWQPILGTCSGTGTSTQQCFAPPSSPLGSTITYSTMSYLAPWPAGTMATMACPAGQLVAGTATSSCQGGVWTPQFGLCQPASGIPGGTGCSPLGAIATSLVNGQASYSPALTATVVVGTTANVVCFSGYQLQGTATSTCTSSGWQPPTLGTCAQMQGGTNATSCNALNPVANGSLSYNQSSVGPFPAGSSVSLTCSQGSTAVGATFATCQNGTWNPSTIGQCNYARAVPGGTSCFAGMPPVFNGNGVYSNNQPFGPYPSGTVFTATCNINFLPSGGMTSTCLNGQWQPATIGTCNANGIGGSGTTGCSAMVIPLNGNMIYSTLTQPYPSGTLAFLTCNMGMRVVGDTVSTCTNGIWTPVAGSCVPMTLQRLPPSLNDTKRSTGDDKEPLNDSEVISNSSVADFSVADASSSTGSALGPVARKPSNDACEPPIAPPFGEITFSEKALSGVFPSGTTAALRCSLGHTTSGPTFSTCRKGSFRPIVGKCVSGEEASLPAICVPLSAPTHARITYIQTGRSLDFEDGTTALLYCEEGFVVSGTATLQCHGGGWEPAAGFGACEATSSSI